MTPPTSISQLCVVQASGLVRHASYRHETGELHWKLYSCIWMKNIHISCMHHCNLLPHHVPPCASKEMYLTNLCLLPCLVSHISPGLSPDDTVFLRLCSSPWWVWLRPLPRGRYQAATSSLRSASSVSTLTRTARATTSTATNRTTGRRYGGHKWMAEIELSLFPTL